MSNWYMYMAVVLLEALPDLCGTQLDGIATSVAVDGTSEHGLVVSPTLVLAPTVQFTLLSL